MNTAEMAVRWFRLFPNGEDDAVFQSFCELRECYGERFRRYHVFQGHVGLMLAWLEEYFPDAPPELAMAVFLHDWICDPRRGDNEEHCAKAAAVLLPELGVPDRSVAAVVEAIPCTYHHVASSPLSAQLCDLDLMSLGLPPEVYAANTAKLRQEHAHESEEEWSQRQQSFIRRTLARLHIYNDAQVQAAFEEAAYRNLTAQLAQLRQAS